MRDTIRWNSPEQSDGHRKIIIIFIPLFVNGGGSSYGFLPGLWRCKKQKQEWDRWWTEGPEVCGVNFFFQPLGRSEGKRQQDSKTMPSLTCIRSHTHTHTQNKCIPMNIMLFIVMTDSFDIDILPTEGWVLRPCWRCGSRPRQIQRHTACGGGRAG